MKKSIFTIMALLVVAVFFASCGSKEAKKEDAAKAEAKNTKVTVNEDIITWSNPTSWNSIPQEYRFIESVQGIYDVCDNDGKMVFSMDFKKTSEVSENTIEQVRSFFFEKGGKKFQADKTASLQQIMEANVGDVVKVTFTYIPSSEKEKQEIYDGKNPFVKIELCLPDDDEDDDDKDLTDLDDELDKAYKKASDEYEKAYKKAQDEYDKAYKKAQKQMEDAMNSYDW